MYFASGSLIVEWVQVSGYFTLYPREGFSNVVKVAALFEPIADDNPVIPKNSAATPTNIAIMSREKPTIATIQRIKLQYLLAGKSRLITQ